MKKILTLLTLIIFSIILTSCNNNIIPEGYISKQIYSDAFIEQIGHTLQYSIYKYDKMPNLKKNRFLENVTTDDCIQLYILLEEYSLRLNEYDKTVEDHDFKNNYNIKLSDINEDDFVYIDDQSKRFENAYFVIYYYETSNNTLYYLQLNYKDVN